MRLSFPSGKLMLLLAPDDCRALALLCRTHGVPQRFQLYSHSLDADAVAMVQARMSGRPILEGSALQASERAGLTLEDLLYLIELGVPDYPTWRPIYQTLANHLATQVEASWDWHNV